MKNLLALLLASLLLLPASACAVTEGVVESAPEVVIDWPEGSGTLFGAWEQGLEDIEAAARSVLEERLNCPDDMQLFMIDVGSDDLVGGDVASLNWQGEDMSTYVSVFFLFEDEDMGGSMCAQVGFDFETGRLGSGSLSRWYGEGEHELAALEIADEPLDMTASEIRQTMDAYLRGALGLQEFEIDNGNAVTLADGTRISVHIGRHTKTIDTLFINWRAEEDKVK